MEIHPCVQQDIGPLGSVTPCHLVFFSDKLEMDRVEILRGGEAKKDGRGSKGKQLPKNKSGNSTPTITQLDQICQQHGKERKAYTIHMRHD